MGLIIGESVLFETYFTVKVVTKGTSEYNRQFFLKPLESSAKVVTKVTSE